MESIGKLHYRNAQDDTGFDALHLPMMVVDGVGMVWASIRDEQGRVSAPTCMLGPHIGAGESKYTSYDTAVTARARQWLADRARRERASPFCLYVGLVAPHFPLVAPEEFYARYAQMQLPEPKPTDAPDFRNHPWIALQDKQMSSESKFKDADERRAAITAYYALVSWLDHNVGQILDALDQAGLGEHHRDLRVRPRRQRRCAQAVGQEQFLRGKRCRADDRCRAGLRSRAADRNTRESCSTSV